MYSTLTEYAMLLLTAGKNLSSDFDSEGKEIERKHAF